MIYPLDFEQRLGFDRVRNMIEERCNTQLAAQMVQELSFSSDYNHVVTELRKVSQMVECLTGEDEFPASGFVDTMPFIGKIGVEGMFIEALELLSLCRTLTLSQEITSFFADKPHFDTLAALCSEIGSFSSEIREINRIIDPTAHVKDSASRELGEIRSRITQKEREVGRRLHSILREAQSEGIVAEDTTLSIREGRAVIPVASALKRKIKGLVYDESATGKTSYIEPLEIVELNNEIKELISEEKREIVRILKSFTSTLRPRFSEIKEVVIFISTIDFIKAKASIAIKQGGVMPKIVKTPELDLRSARHPLLEEHLKKEYKAIVPLDLWLTAQKHILLISGPNAGGKSVCLKSVGLLSYMVQSGVLVPVNENSTFGIFNDIFVDIGDQQSLDNDLSTYSSHLQNMKAILKNGKNNSLVLIDEFGTGTEPAMGGAIAEAILERMEERGMFGVITTHYSNLKYYADNSSAVINGAMSFDVQKISPLFRLEIGKPGSSFAFEIAHKIGLDSQIIASAKEKVGSSQVNLEKRLREIARDKRYWETKRDKIRVAEKKADELSQNLESEIAKLKEQRNSLIRDAKVKAAEIVSGANKVIENTIREIKESQADRERSKLARKEVELFKESLSSDKDENQLAIERKMAQLKERGERRKNRQAQKEVTKDKEEVEIVAPKPKAIKIGDNVRVAGQSVIGKVWDISGKRATIHFGSISTTVEVKKLEYISNNEVKKEQTTAQSSAQFKSNYDTSQKRLNFSQQIDIRGVRVDEAMIKTQDFVDEAYMLGFSEIKILHGKGSGALKQEIRRLLATMPEVESFADEHEQFGGAGITVIQIKN